MAINDLIQESYLYDIDLEGGVDTNGNISQLWQGDAIINALKFWIVSKKGDYINYPNRGGYVIQHILKPMNEDRVDQIKMSIMTGLANDFVPPLDIVGLKVEPNYSSRYWHIYMKVYSRDYNLTAELDEDLAGR